MVLALADELASMRPGLIRPGNMTLIKRHPTNLQRFNEARADSPGKSGAAPVSPTSYSISLQ